uniref:Uncharacterized protein n=1 Tax=Oryza meridionalis TaxID=40149 RepID=A0A0E0E588_9ORYZ
MNVSKPADDNQHGSSTGKHTTAAATTERWAVTMAVWHGPVMPSRYYCLCWAMRAGMGHGPAPFFRLQAFHACDPWMRAYFLLPFAPSRPKML